MIQQWDFPVDELVSLPDYRRSCLAAHLDSITARVAAGTSPRALAAEYGVSHEAVRQLLQGQAASCPRASREVAPTRWTRQNTRSARGRSLSLSEAEIKPARARPAAGMSMRARPHLRRLARDNPATLGKLIWSAVQAARSARLGSILPSTPETSAMRRRCQCPLCPITASSALSQVAPADTPSNPGSCPRSVGRRARPRR